MVDRLEKDGKAYYQCGVCRVLYADRLWAVKCEEWCRRHRSCNTGIIKHAVTP
jgi:hypothetical protein